MLLTHWTPHELIASLALGYQIALLLHPVNGVPNGDRLKCWKNLWKIVLVNMPLAKLIHKVKSQQLFNNI